MLKVEKFLCCCPLDIGVVIIGNICILLSFLSIYELNQNDDYGELMTIHGVNSTTLSFIELLRAIVLIVVSFLLIIGAMKRQQQLVKLWLAVLALYMIMECTTIITAVVLPEFIILKEPIIVHFAISLFILSYFWYCVYQFDQELIKRNNLLSLKVKSLNVV